MTDGTMIIAEREWSLDDLIHELQTETTITLAPDYPCPECGEESDNTGFIGEIETSKGTVTIDTHEFTCRECGHVWYD